MASWDLSKLLYFFQNLRCYELKSRVWTLKHNLMAVTTENNVQKRYKINRKQSSTIERRTLFWACLKSNKIQSLSPDFYENKRKTQSFIWQDTSCHKKFTLFAPVSLNVENGIVVITLSTFPRKLFYKMWNMRCCITPRGKHLILSWNLE